MGAASRSGAGVAGNEWDRFIESEKSSGLESGDRGETENGMLGSKWVAFATIGHGGRVRREPVLCGVKAGVASRGGETLRSN